jgi:hypothetical protein
MLTRIEVTGEKSFSYLREHLYLSGKVLASALETFSLDKGRVFTFVPEDIPHEKLTEFNEGVLYPVDVELSKKPPFLVPVQNDARPMVQELVLNYLTQDATHCCIIEEPVGAPDDPWVKKEKVEYIHIGQEMYYFFNRHAEATVFRETFQTAENYYFLCALGALNMEAQQLFTPFHHVEKDQIKSFAETVSSFIVKAYDGEGYLQWLK